MDTPATKPSSPSIRLIAFVIATIHKTVKQNASQVGNTSNGPQMEF